MVDSDCQGGSWTTASLAEKDAMCTEYRYKYAGPGKDVVRGHMMWLPHHPRRSLGKGVERGHMMWLPHLPPITTVHDTVELS